ncbi:hypothetical protein AMECASPLE_037254 [Ameca splendens]|uniref:Arginine vasopressin-induced protein 1/transcriptional and immune response regulator domain-containing protein n=1 Tax=Ameca splendens TaxID=208324 RepID=A0ABV0XWX1_9TELE
MSVLTEHCPLRAHKYSSTALLCTHSLQSLILYCRSGLNSAHRATHHRKVGAPRLGLRTTSRKRVEMSSYVSSESRRVSPTVHGNKFDTAHRKKAVANIFENVNQDALMRLFQKTGDMKAEERVRSIFYTQDPEETARALMALKQRKKDKFLRIADMVRQLLKLR